jgi:NAD(P)-dependent dehydrogenase (short-subunit alcohol dehydrogenase family)
MQTVSITGINKGIGKGLALKFLNEGFFVIGTSLDSTIDFNHDNLKVLQLDLFDEQSIGSCVENVKKLDRKIDIHINNAGILLDEGEPDIDIDKLKKTLQVNLIGPIDLTQKILSLINEGGHIVNISSSAASLTNIHHADYPAYKISKTAVNMFTSWLAFKLKDKITVSSIHPGRVKTDMGHWEGDTSIEDAVEHIFQTSIKKDLETGQFWFKGEKFPW